jgi:SAM-dependent methyltransferase
VTAGATQRGPSTAQELSNATTWAKGEHLHGYANQILTPVEVLLFARYQDTLSGRVLDVGCGAGRVLSYLLMFGAETVGIDLAPAMVEYCNRMFPAADVRLGDVAALAESVEGTFDAILAPDNLIDVFGDAERRHVLAGFREVLRPDGRLIFSTHDLAYLDHTPGPREWETPSRRQTLAKFVERSPAEMVRAVRRRRREAANKRRLGPLQEWHADHAIINDFPHDYSLLHYYIRRDDQERQLAEVGFELVECLDVNGNTLGPGGSGPTDSLHYVARPS